MIRVIGLFMLVLGVVGAVYGDEPRAVSSDKFAAIHRMIKRQPGEWPWAELPWTIDFADAQRKAISAGKPIFVALAAQGSPVGCL
ncbi:MAG: hypothetical protein N2039_15195 [Gemmataceae bacterium]|nr:hypothetical protein [Gemmataceae bacterium]